VTDPALIVIAKAPVPGRVKTRLCPPCTDWQAAMIAEAALADTLEAVRAVPVARRAVVLDGEPGDWLPPGFALHQQVAGGLDARLAGAFAAVGGPALLIGMDTPQVGAGLLEASLATLLAGGVGAALGGALDGGYWAIGLRKARAEAFIGVPMSTPWTARAQRDRLRRLGLACVELPGLRDVDTFADARAVAAACPGSRFAEAVEPVGEGLTVAATAAG
jgi:uncharacterized protein